MKKAIIVLLFTLCCFTLFFLATHSIGKTSQAGVQLNNKTIISTPTPFPVATPATTTLFVPYWTMNTKKMPIIYDTLAYFGITANSSGIDTQEDGYLGLPKFVRLTQPSQKTLLVVRLIDNTVDEKVLASSVLQQKIISDSIVTAQKYHFDGIVLDFEYNALAFDSVVNSISHFSQSFATGVYNSHLTYYQTIYGDTFYRLRPFDASTISKDADGIFVMAYDFHKANGDPGPNFPLHMLSDEDYSFTQMIQDFTKKVPYQKITIVFGMFGYDWTLNNKDNSASPGASITTTEAQAMFANPCTLKNCSIIRDSNATEEHGSYTDNQNQKHEVWFEDMTSVQAKQNYLKTQGISSTGFWAYSYF